MEDFNYTLEIESKSMVKDANPDEPAFNHNVSVSDEQDDQMIKISPRMVFSREGKKFTILTHFYYKVPYGQGVINFENIVSELVYQSFCRQKEIILANSPRAEVPEIVRHTK